MGACNIGGLALTNTTPSFLSGEDAAAATSQEPPRPYIQGVQRLLAQALQSCRPAMISTPARQAEGRLIALSQSCVPHVDPFAEAAFLGFAERERLAVKPAREGRSTKDDPQSCGKAQAGVFDVAGLVAWLRRRFPRYTAINVEAATGISAASVENWLQFRSQPSVEHFSLMVLAFGPSFLRASMREDADWLVRAEADAMAAELSAEIEELEQRRRELMERARV